MALAVARDPDDLDRACATLVAARPTAVNLAHAVNRVRAAVAAGPASQAAQLALTEAEAIEAQEVAASRAMATMAPTAVGRRRLLTHCNTGALAAPGAAPRWA